MDLDTITVTQFKDFFLRDFPFLPNFECSPQERLNYVLDSDIQRAFSEAKISFNQALFGDDAEITMGYLYLTAHYLTIDLRAASGGIYGGGLAPVSARQVGNVSEKYEIPDMFIDNPVLAILNSTPYGMKYLALVLPKIVGNVVAICGRTLP